MPFNRLGEGCMTKTKNRISSISQWVKAGESSKHTTDFMTTNLVISTSTTGLEIKSWDDNFPHTKQ